ncbi:acetolactate synthase 3 catalytic subunit [Pseudomonas mandelii JR-1]|uniref:Acetolactate synthase 3 catalytic subunit n=1 Tax=Pseudomonas mandelii JR-1 TaxID=1147786 RepID=A0A024EGK8_9PSED|nr:acetolactate synthase 3 catalytic subunit [Pseudomonas mandelii JR-1]
MTNENMLNGWFFEQRVVDMQCGTTWVPIDIFNAFVTQKADEHLTAR